MNDLAPANSPSAAPQGAVVQGWRGARKKVRPTNVESVRVECDVFNENRLEGSTAGHLSRTEGWLHFEGQDFRFSLPRSYFLDSSEVPDQDHGSILLALYHPTQVIHLRFEGKADGGAQLRSMLRKFLIEPKIAEAGGIYPPFTPQPSSNTVGWGTRVRIAAVIGLLWLALGQQASVLFHQALLGAMILGYLVSFPTIWQNKRQRTEEIPPPNTQLEPFEPGGRYQAFANIIQKRDLILPELLDVKAQPKAAALIPPARTKGSFPALYHFVGSDISAEAARAWRLVRTATQTPSWVAYCKVESAVGSTTVVSDIGLVSIEGGALSFTGHNVSFRLGGQFVEDTQSYPADGMCSCWIPLIHPGHRVWVGFEEIRRQDSVPSLYDSVQEFKRSNLPSPLQTVYPPTRFIQKSGLVQSVRWGVSIFLICASVVLTYMGFFDAAVGAATLGLILDLIPVNEDEEKRVGWSKVSPAARAPVLRKNIFD